MKAREQLITQASRRAQREDRWGGKASGCLLPILLQALLCGHLCANCRLSLSSVGVRKSFNSVPLDCTSQPLGPLQPCVLALAQLLSCFREQVLLRMCPSSSGRFFLNLNLGKPTWFVQDCPGFSTGSPMSWEISQCQASGTVSHLASPHLDNGPRIPSAWDLPLWLFLVKFETSD